MVHIQIYGHIPFFFILGRGLFQCPPLSRVAIFAFAFTDITLNMTLLSKSLSIFASGFRELYPKTF